VLAVVATVAIKAVHLRLREQPTQVVVAVEHQEMVLHGRAAQAVQAS
jgi:hypothetical protein